MFIILLADYFQSTEMTCAFLLQEDKSKAMYLFMYLFIYMYLYTCTYLVMYLWPVSNPPIVPATPYYSNKYLIFKGQNHRIFPKTIRNLKFAFLKMFCMLKDSKSKNVLHAG